MKIGIDIGGSHIAIGLVESKGKIVIKKEKNISKEDRKDIYKFIEETIVITTNQILKECKIEKQEIEQIGIACPGTSKEGIVIKADNVGIYNYPIIERLQKYFSMPIKISNDAKCAGLCEKKYGALKANKDAVFICLGTGIGGAVFMNGKMLQPKRYQGMELGHITIKKDGIECKCGRKRMFRSICINEKVKR